MEKFETLTAIAAPLMRINIDTDAIIPSREMKRPSKKGLAVGLFAGWRYSNEAARIPDPDFILNQPPFDAAQILLAGVNFGCGSSREHAVWALREWGIRAVIAPSFGAIFYSNAVRNGLLPLVLDDAIVTAWAEAVKASPGVKLTLDLAARQATGPDGSTETFEIAPQHHEMLLLGLDGIGVTVKEHGDAIDAFEAGDRARRPWVYLAR